MDTSTPTDQTLMEGSVLHSGGRNRDGVHPHTFPKVPGSNGQPMALTWRGPGKARPKAPHLIRKARPTSGRNMEAAAGDDSYATPQHERRRIQRANRKAYREQR